MRAKMAAAAALVAILFAAGCGADATEDTGSSSTEPTPTATASPVPQDTPSPAVPETTEEVPPFSEGANAAPVDVPQTYNGVYDASQPALNYFYQIWQYETQTDQGRARLFDTAYTDGVVSCGKRALGQQPVDIAYELERNKGYLGSDSVAVVAAAFRALCPKSNEEGNSTDYVITGYLTKFDQNVASAYNLVVNDPSLNLFGQTPKITDVGWFGKYTCYYLSKGNDPSGLFTYLPAYQNAQFGTSFLAATDQRTFETLVVTTTLQMCPGYGNFQGGWSN